MRDVEPGHQSAAGTQRTPCGLGNLGAEMAEEQIGEKERERERKVKDTEVRQQPTGWQRHIFIVSDKNNSSLHKKMNKCSLARFSLLIIYLIGC